MTSTMMPKHMFSSDRHETLMGHEHVMNRWMDCVMTTTTTAAQEPWAAMCAAQTTATSHANVQQGVQYMTDELRAGQNAAKGRQQAAPTSSRRAPGVHQPQA